MKVVCNVIQSLYTCIMLSIPITMCIFFGFFFPAEELISFTDIDKLFTYIDQK